MAATYEFIDFVPEVRPGGLFSETVAESTEQVVVRLNDWVAANKVRVVNIETLVLPQYGATLSSGAPRYRSNPASWVQVVRVWFVAAE